MIYKYILLIINIYKDISNVSYVTDEIANSLKGARESRGLSQRALSEKSGVPQGHISKIENGTVDLRLSSLIALARALELELALVPRVAVPAVKSIVRGAQRSIEKRNTSIRAAHSLANLPETAPLRPAYSLEEDDDG